MYLYLLPKFAIIYKNSKVGFLMRIYNWLNKNKDSENILIQLLRLIYTVEISTPVHVILSSIIGIFIPLLISKHLALSIILLIIFVLGNILHFVSEGFHTKNFEERKFAKNILADQSSLINSMGIIINTDPHWKNIIFKEMCDAVCSKIHEEFKEVYKCDVRVSVEYVFEKNTDNSIDTYRKMAGRYSNERVKPKKATTLSSREKYFSYKIFHNNLGGLHVLNEEDFSNPDIWYATEHNIKIYHYLGIANSFNDKDVVFILQIDCLQNFNFGNNNSDKDIKSFVDAYIKPYANIISVAYLLGRNKNGKVGEV